MKKLLSVCFVVTLYILPCQAQFGAFGRILKGAKAAADARKTAKKSQEDAGNRKVKDIYNDPEYQKAREDAQRQYDQLYEENLKKHQNIAQDSAAYAEYMKGLTGGQQIGENPAVEDQETMEKIQKLSKLNDDPHFQKIMAEKRPLTKEEALYFNEKYGTTFEYEGMEALKDSVGVFAALPSGMNPMGITKYESISDEKPIPDFGQDFIKQYVQNYIAFLKKPLADREIIDSVQNYLIYSHRHADVQFKDKARFTLYSNLEMGSQDLTVNDFVLRKVADFTEPVDPKNIFVFKVHKGIGCRYMEYMYSKISYMQSELTDYVVKSLINEGYIDTGVDQKVSDGDFMKALYRFEYQFKLGKLLKIRQNKEKFLYTNVIPEARGVKITSNTRKVDHVTALDITIDAEPGEYAFIVRNPQVEQYLKQALDKSDNRDYQNFDVSVLTQGAFFFTIK